MTAAAAEHFDVLIIGAGISGIGSAYHLKTQLPEKSFVVLEAMPGFGGTWRTHRYPGVRSDSDLFTFGYRFKPWVGPPIASGDEILKYLDEVIEENDLGSHIRYGHRITGASWSSHSGCWTVEALELATGQPRRFTTHFLWMCQGYYRHEEGYTPDWPGMARFPGRIVHPQCWPEDLDYSGKRVIVIGSGATAATLVPAIADACAHVTMVQRSPTYFLSGPNSNELAETLRALDVDKAWVHEIVRRKILQESAAFSRRAAEEPEAVRQEILQAIAAQVGPDLTAKHFTPSYRPWRQRIAFIPEGDIFRKVREGKASLVTDEIETFTETGLKMKGEGGDLDADIIVTATGFNVSVLGDIPFEVDGHPVNFSGMVNYRGMMIAGVPNLAWVFGYFRYSWTLRVDLMGDFICRLLKNMDALGCGKLTVQFRPQDQGMPLSTWSDPEDFNPGYLMRGLHLMPKSGHGPEWRHTQDYMTDKEAWPSIDVNGPEFSYALVPQRCGAFAAE